MKNFKTVSSLLGATILFSLSKSYAGLVQFSDLEKDSTQTVLYTTIKNIMKGDMSYVESVNIPDCSLQTTESKYTDNVKINLSRKNENLSFDLPIRNVKYADLTDVEKKVFDFYSFDKEKYIKIIGFVPRVFIWGSNILYRTSLSNGSFTRENKIQYIKWVPDQRLRDSLVPNYKTDCPKIKFIHDPLSFVVEN